MLRQRSRTIIIVVVVALFVGYSVHTAVESRRTQAVARAIEEYMAVLDAEWVDADCMPDHCPKSSKSLPGVPQDRALFTSTEGSIIRGRGKDVSTVAPVRSSLAIYELKKQKHGVVEAYVDITVTQCPFSGNKGDPYEVLPDLYRITLAPSGVDKHNYVVMDDEYLNPTKYRPGPGGVAIYYRDNGRKPQCFG